MKRLFARFLAPVLVLSLSVPAFAFAAADSARSTLKETGNTYFKGTPGSRLIEGNLSGALAGDSDVLHFLTSNKEKLSLSSQSASSKQSFMMSKKNTDAVGKTHYVYQQSQNGVPVYGSYVQVNVDSARKVYALQNSVDTDLDLAAINTTPKLAADAAVQAFKKDLEADYKGSIELETKLQIKTGSLQYPKPTAKLMIYPYKGKTYLAYEVNMSFIHPAHANWVGYVDANTGKIIDKYNKLQDAYTPMTGTGYGYNGASKSLKISKYTEGSYTDYELIDLTHFHDDKDAIFTGSFYEISDFYATWSKTTTFKDNASFPPHYYSAAVDAHYNANLVYNYYKNTLGRDSIDGNGMDLYSFVNVPDEDGYPMDNAFWDGNAMYYGDGSGVANHGMNCTSCALDIVAHELTHGVTQYTSGLEYRNQSGALNESFSDIMGAVIDSSDWDMGEDSGDIARNLQDPGKYGQPAKMSDPTYWPETDERDNGGVHTNSGIPNHAAYLMANKIDAAAIPSLSGRTALGKLTYIAMQSLFPTANFSDARSAYLLAVDSLPNLTAAQVKKLKSIVIDAWAEVGISEAVSDFTGSFISTATSATLNLNWSMGSGATSVTVQQSTDGGSTWTTAATGTLASTATTATVSNLLPSEHYLFRLVVGGGSSAGISNEISLDTPAAIDLTVISQTGATVSLSWTAVAGATSVIMQQSTNGGSTWTTAKTSALNAASTNTTVTGLQAGTAIKFRLSITGGYRAGFSNVADTVTESAPVADFALKTATTTTVTFTWTATVRASKIIIEQYTGDSWVTAKSSPISTSAITATVTGLVPNTAYKFHLRVEGGANAGTTTEVNVKTLPVQISNFASTGKTATTASFRWTPSAGANATSVTVEKSTDSSTWTTATEPLAANAAIATVADLTPNKAYSFRLKVVGGINEGNSNTVAVTTTPQQIADLARTNATLTSVSLEWTPAKEATAVVLQQSTNGTTWTPAATGTLSANAASATVTGLLQGAPYKFRLLVTGGQNAGNSTVLDATTLTVPIGNFALKGATTTTNASFTWTAAVRATSIVIEQSADGGESWRNAAGTKISTSAAMATVTGLTPNTTYKFRLKVVGGANAGTTTEVGAKTLPVQITSFASTGKTATTASFRWTPSTGANTTTVTIEKSTDSSTWTPATDTLAANATVATVTDLIPNKAYSFRLKVVGGINEGNSNAVAVTTIPQPIADMKRNDDTTTYTSISLEWTPAKEATAVVLQQSANGTTWTPAAITAGTLSPDASNATVTGLLQGAPYKFRLVVTGGQNAGISAVLDATTLTVPVADFASKGAATTTSASFAWTAVVRAKSIIIEQSSDGGLNWRRATSSTISASATTASVTGLTPNTAYQFRLNVTSGANAGTSNNVEAKTLPMQITSFASTGKTATTAAFRWTPSTGANASAFTVEQSTDQVNWETSTTTVSPLASNATVATVTGLTPNKAYSFRLKVVGGMNEGLSNVTAVTTIPQPITDLTRSEATTLTSISLQWTPAIDATAIVLQQSTYGTTWTPAATGTLSADAAEATVTGLLQGTSLKFRLVVTGGQNQGNSNMLDATTLTEPVADFALKASPSKTSASFTWTAAIRATSIIIEQSSDGGVTWRKATSTTISTSATSATVTGLTSNTAYLFRLKVVGGANAGTSASVVETKTSY